MTTVATIPPLPAAIPSGLSQSRPGFWSDPFFGAQADEKALRLKAKRNATQKFVNVAQQVMNLPLPRPRQVSAEGPFLFVVNREYAVNPDPANPTSGIVVMVHFSCELWSLFN